MTFRPASAWGCSFRRARVPGGWFMVPWLVAVAGAFYQGGPASTAAFAQAPPAPPTDADILALMKTHCVPCHAAEPTHEAFARAPAGVLLETIAQVAGNAAKVMAQVVVNRAMPLGNQTGMTDEERDRIAAWVEGRGK